MIYLLDTNVVAEITTRPKPAPAVVAWARSVPSRSPDALIAAPALANGWTLVSRNLKHLARSGALLLNPWEYEGWAIEAGTHQTSGCEANK
ncbi:hypothetical protein [Streptomyces lavendulae]|uniref:hypothetical protein n=1 Tax=Streptomyces lavendulae TaxID=1914 RepID=UPI0024A525EA|nr:hypothetical protein [Streptomyces lavendulae]GLW02011.1 hypothetical protein Slala05_56420 [Streptomyces lavendulae subsp. lavendulae]